MRAVCGPEPFLPRSHCRPRRRRLALRCLHCLVNMAPKAATAARRLNTIKRQKDKMAQSWSAIVAKENDLDAESKDEANIMAIMEELLKSPAKIEGCRKAVESDFFLIQDEDDDSAPLHASLTRMHRVPKKFFKKLLEKWCPKLMSSAAAVSHLNKEDRMWVVKANYYSLVIGPKTRIAHHDKKILTELLTERYKAKGCLLQKFNFDEVPGKAFMAKGLFELVLGPSASGSAAPSTVVDMLRFVPMDLQLPLPRMFTVTSSWTIDDNYCLKMAILRPPEDQAGSIAKKKRRRMGIRCWEIFEEHDGFREFVEDMTVLDGTGGEEDEDDDDDGELCDDEDGKPEEQRADSDVATPKPKRKPQTPKKGIAALPSPGKPPSAPAKSPSAKSPGETDKQLEKLRRQMSEVKKQQSAA